MMWHSHDGMGWWMLFGGVFWLLFWVSIVVLLVRGFSHREHHHHDESTEAPMETARRRLARGEISAPEFEEIARHLRSAPG
jgi:uncharacterized membrane protein